MSGKMSAAWWRDYRARNRTRLNAQMAARRAAASPEQRAARRRAEARRRMQRTAEARDRRDAEPMAATLTGDPIFELAAEAVRRAQPKPGGFYQFTAELTWEDAMMAATEAILAGEGPEGAKAAASAEWAMWRPGWARPIAEEHVEAIAGPGIFL